MRRYVSLCFVMRQGRRLRVYGEVLPLVAYPKPTAKRSPRPAWSRASRVFYGLLGHELHVDMVAPV